MATVKFGSLDDIEVPATPHLLRSRQTKQALAESRVTVALIDSTPYAVEDDVGVILVSTALGNMVVNIPDPVDWEGRQISIQRTLASNTVSIFCDKTLGFFKDGAAATSFTMSGAGTHVRLVATDTYWFVLG